MLHRWAYAKLGMMPPESFMVAAAQQMLHDMARSVPQDISNMLWVRATHNSGTVTALQALCTPAACAPSLRHCDSAAFLASLRLVCRRMPRCGTARARSC